MSPWDWYSGCWLHAHQRLQAAHRQQPLAHPPARLGIVSVFVTSSSRCCPSSSWPCSGRSCLSRLVAPIAIGPATARRQTAPSMEKCPSRRHLSETAMRPARLRRRLATALRLGWPTRPVATSALLRRVRVDRARGGRRRHLDRSILRARAGRKPPPSAECWRRPPRASHPV